ncbi:MAG: ribonuclease Z [Nitrospirota bacterium]
MSQFFVSKMLNGPFDDPCLFISILRERRALLVDLGHMDVLEPRNALKVSDIFVSHTHIDHFIGFDYMLRVLLGRGKELRIFGPSGIISNVEGKLSGYTWNLIDGYQSRFIVHEVDTDRIDVATFGCTERFEKQIEGSKGFNGILLDESEFLVRCEHLDHNIPSEVSPKSQGFWGCPSLAFSIEEKMRININKDRLQKSGIPVGPWLSDLKECIRKGLPEDYPFIAYWKTNGQREEKRFSLGEITREIAMITKGQKIVYVTDAQYTDENIRKIITLAANADIFYCEASFLDRDRERAMMRGHLTAKQVGEIARQANVRELTIFHFSPKYRSIPEEFYNEAMKAWKI